MDADHPTAAPQRFAVLIPAYDCASTITAVVDGARSAQIGEVLVVDDGSADDTAARAAAAGAAVLRLSPNRGKGAALRAGLAALSARGATHALSMDGDGQHLARELPALCAASRAAPAALVVGARRIGTQEVKPIKLFGNRFANRWVEIACGVALPDSQSGLRVYPIAATRALDARADRFAFETEVLIRAARAGMVIESIPVDVYYPPPEERVSHYAPLRDTLRIIAVVLRLILWR
jgi:glycosyltransferase involved in cell wall biosynthesis